MATAAEQAVRGTRAAQLINFLFQHVDPATHPHTGIFHDMSVRREGSSGKR